MQVAARWRPAGRSPRHALLVVQHFAPWRCLLGATTYGYRVTVRDRAAGQEHAGTAQGARLTASTTSRSVSPSPGSHPSARFDHNIVVPNTRSCVAWMRQPPRSEEGEAASLEALTGLGVQCGGGVLEGGVEGEAGAPVDGRIVGLDE